MYKTKLCNYASDNLLWQLKKVIQLIHSLLDKRQPRVGIDSNNKKTNMCAWGQNQSEEIFIQQTHRGSCYSRVLLGCESIGIIILPRVPLLAARERSRVEMLLDASSPSAPATQTHSSTQIYSSSYVSSACAVLVEETMVSMI